MVVIGGGAPTVKAIPGRRVGLQRRRDLAAAGLLEGRDATMALALVARLTDEPTARMVQLWVEYDPHPPFGGIDWEQVDRDMAEPVVARWVKTQLADRPELLARLRG